MAADPQARYCEPEEGIAYVALDPGMLVELATAGSPPLVVLGLKPRADYGYDLILRRPNIFELTAAIDNLPKTEAS